MYCADDKKETELIEKYKTANSKNTSEKKCNNNFQSLIFYCEKNCTYNFPSFINNNITAIRFNKVLEANKNIVLPPPKEII